MTTQVPTNVPPIEDWNLLLDGKVAVVTGGGAGIGAAICELFARHGAVLEVAEIDADRARSIEDIVKAVGGRITVQVVDVTDAKQVDDFAADVLRRHGTIDVLVNNVGDFRPNVPFRESSPESWKTMYDLNLGHIFGVTRAFINPMTEAGHGSIINFHSVEGMRGYAGEPVYGAMKAAAAHFTTCLAVHVGRFGVRVNGIGPDLTQSPQVNYLKGWEESDHLWPSWSPVGRLGWPEDQARVALFLASDMSSFVTGHNIPVDGGTKAGGGWFWSPTENRFVNRPRTL
ncbi:MAG: 3-oxoacyl-[acyl-carrier-protein] reductase FabG [Actinomycetota bacterium]|jgi:NAD(P)-dependent dehydrogenase (short-subunit alcohol dehydrogenase family)